MTVSQSDPTSQLHRQRVAVHVLLVLLVTAVFIAGTAAHREVHGRILTGGRVMSSDSRTERHLALFELVDAKPLLVLGYFLLCICVIVLSLKRRYPHWAVCVGTFSLLLPGLMYGIFCLVVISRLSAI